MIVPMDSMGTALWELYANQKVKGLLGAMRQTLTKIEQSGQSDAQWFNAMGEMAQLEKNYTVAARFFRQAYEEKNRPEYELNWGNALFYAKNFHSAKKILTGYQEKYPEDVHGLVNLANCYLQLSELEKVKELCNQGLTALVAKSPLWNCLGQVAYLEKQYEQAWTYFNKAYIESPEYIDALFNRGNMAYHLGRTTDALADFAQCLRKDENYEAALLNGAVIRLEMGEWELGKAEANRALKLNPDSVEALHVLGRLHLAGKEFRAARDVFRNTLKQDPEHVPTLLALAKLHIQEAEPDEASSVLKRVLAKVSLLPEERVASLTLLMELELHSLCIHHISKLPEGDLSIELRKVLLISLWKTGKIKEAIQQLENLLNTEGETAGNLTLLGKMLAQSGAVALAESRFKKALELDSGAQGPACELARIHLARGEGGRAIAILESLLTQHPDDADCLYNLACCHAKNRNFDDSLHNLKKAVENGFQDLDKITADEDLNYIRQFEGYTELAVQIGFS
jgi:tetratricopeptide (TPR) repeat protein